jgi:hypothetical protein
LDARLHALISVALLKASLEQVFVHAALLTMRRIGVALTLLRGKRVGTAAALKQVMVTEQSFLLRALQEELLVLSQVRGPVLFLQWYMTVVKKVTRRGDLSLLRMASMA